MRRENGCRARKFVALLDMIQITKLDIYNLYDIQKIKTANVRKTGIIKIHFLGIYCEKRKRLFSEEIY